MPSILLFNKPFGVLSQFTGEQYEQTLSAYIDLPNFYAAGRLDKNSEGLLLLANEGRIQHRLSHPKFNKKKYYWVQVEGAPQENDLQPLRQGLRLKETQFLPAQVKLIAEPPLWPRNPPIRFRKTVPTTWLEIILQEGKNHQIRRMTAAIGFPTLRLVRHRIANWSLGDIPPGEYRLLDVESL
ncbi:pseudouridine synthase [Legionella jordanis]|uniref:23S rRNA pseudouridine synthase n=1 Tax=Legionella jordanis TaxID=456 RepID=A0A0W0VFK9_9GAMM|nr:pseudouridine synthase [Legionella jordanis]KTD18916.1 23S rRNA pseudouridine synthase [Legionella jordanis]RMX05520.1 pseudouridine synthase [Legionella jordanis]RMX19205.1 pseudouridine synthase [Legionella jordanis]VEH13016.1 23S rRNA pseudouridine synthase [Legionella jordanis]HAT8714059.1 pseudouridine synthase [Legionella jordanis]